MLFDRALDIVGDELRDRAEPVSGSIYPLSGNSKERLRRGGGWQSGETLRWKWITFELIACGIIDTRLCVFQFQEVR